jgi:hypothetical protein
MVSAAHELQRERDTAIVVHARFGDDEDAHTTLLPPRTGGRHAMAHL